MSHLLTIEPDDNNVLAFCTCGWGYTAPDADAAEDAHWNHMLEQGLTPEEVAEAAGVSVPELASEAINFLKGHGLYYPPEDDTHE